jgi:hypothetical protein
MRRKRKHSQGQPGCPHRTTPCAASVCAVWI